MDRTCQKCGQPVPQEAFLCPHCGAILEAHTPKVEEPKQKKVRKWNLRHILSVALALGLIAAVVVFVGAVLKLVGPAYSDPTTQVTQPTTQAPLVAYEVKVRTDNRKNMKGALVQVCKDGEVLYSCEAGNYGTATFILPKSDGYTIRLSQMMQPFEILYSGQEFPFEPGQQSLEIVLENKEVPYSVKVVNRDGEPLAGTRLAFDGPSDVQRGDTDENGICVFMDRYSDVEDYGPQVYFDFCTTGYLAQYRFYKIESGTFEITIVLDRYEELTIPDGSALYRVRVTDESGQPVAAQSAQVMNDLGLYTPVQTNYDGVFAFIGKADQDYSVAFLKDPDYSNKTYPFAQGQTELDIILPNKNTTGPWIYEVVVHDQYEHPVPDAEVVYQNPDGTLEYFRSDADGLVRMELPEEDPSKVTVRLNSVPSGYEASGTFYTFGAYSRLLPIVVTQVAESQVIIQVVDQFGNPVTGVTVAIRDGNQPQNEEYFTPDANGEIRVMLDPRTFYECWIYDYPMGYLSNTPPQYIDVTNDVVIFVVERYEPAQAYTYTVQFVDQYGNPVSGVELYIYFAYWNLDYVSDENGMITFVCGFEDPSQVYLVVWPPDGYFLHDYPGGVDGLPEYRYPEDSRTLIILLDRLEETPC